MTGNEILNAAWMATLNQLNGRMFPEMRGAFPALRRRINQILREAPQSGMSGLGDGIFDTINSAVTAAADIYKSMTTARTDVKLQTLALQSQQAQANAAQQIAAINAAGQVQASSEQANLVKYIALGVGGLTVAGFIAWLALKRR